MTPPPEAQANGSAMPRRFVTGVVWVGAAVGLQAVFRVLLIAILTKYLGPARYGLWSVFLATVEILVPLAALGMRYGYSRSRAGMGQSRESAAALYAAGAVVLFFSLLLAGLWWLSAGWFAATFMNGNPAGRRMVQVGGLILVFGTAELMLREYFGTFLQMRARGLVIVARFSLDVAAAVAVMVLGWGPVELAACMMVSRCLPTAVGLALVVRRFGLVRPDWSVVMPYMKFGLPLQLAGVASLVIRLGDRQVLGALRSEAETGVFSASSDLGLLILMMVYTIQPVLFPALSTLFNQGRKDEAVWLFERTLTYFFFLTIPMVAFLSVAAGSVLTLFTTSAFAGAGAVLAPLVAAGTVLFGVSAMARNLLGMVQRTSLAMVIWLTAAVVKVGLTFLFVRAWGVVGAGVSSVVVAALLAAVSWRASRRYLPWGLEGVAVGKAVLAAAVAAVPAWFLVRPDLLRLAAGGLAFSVVFVGLMFGLGAIRIADIRTLAAMLLKKGDSGDAAPCARGR